MGTLTPIPTHHSRHGIPVVSRQRSASGRALRVLIYLFLLAFVILGAAAWFTSSSPPSLLGGKIADVSSTKPKFAQTPLRKRGELCESGDCVDVINSQLVVPDVPARSVGYGTEGPLDKVSQVRRQLTVPDIEGVDLDRNNDGQPDQPITWTPTFPVSTRNDDDEERGSKERFCSSYPTNDWCKDGGIPDQSRCYSNNRRRGHNDECRPSSLAPSPRATQNATRAVAYPGSQEALDLQREWCKCHLDPHSSGCHGPPLVKYPVQRYSRFECQKFLVNGKDPHDDGMDEDTVAIDPVMPIEYPLYPKNQNATTVSLGIEDLLDQIHDRCDCFREPDSRGCRSLIERAPAYDKFSDSYCQRFYGEWHAEHPKNFPYNEHPEIPFSVWKHCTDTYGKEVYSCPLIVTSYLEESTIEQRQKEYCCRHSTALECLHVPREETCGTLPWDFDDFDDINIPLLRKSVDPIVPDEPRPDLWENLSSDEGLEMVDGEANLSASGV
jgi:hypothetical protein